MTRAAHARRLQLASLSFAALLGLPPFTLASHAQQSLHIIITSPATT